ncbi:MAG TPA: cupin domain-containing protein [Rhizomicrobium sp.]|jgi:uncharacterized cupin superfamily protein|nr:cupin domain-containing protein [Rhizomicrobium sp.]
MKRPTFIKSWREIEAAAAPPSSQEDFGFASELSAAAGLNHLRVAHLRIPPGTRGYPPLAMEDMEIFAFVLEGAPDLWLDGALYRLRGGDGVTFQARTGIAHALINNSDRDARVFVMSEPFLRSSRVVHPLDAAANANLGKMNMLWPDPPKRKLGPNSGRPGDLSGRKRGRLDDVVQWRDILDEKANHYPNSDELQGLSARFGRRARFSRIGIHLNLLKPGRRTSWPHAERDEEEFAYVVSGEIEAWNDGYTTALGEGDFIGWRAKTGITHTLINNGDRDALLLVGGEANRQRAQVWYPLHPHRDKETGEAFWADHPVPKLGPHDGIPDALRARVPKRALSNAVSANEAARFLGKRMKT